VNLTVQAKGLMIIKVKRRPDPFFLWLAVEKVGHSAAEVARFPGISRVGVKKAVERGRQLGQQGLLDE